MRKLLLVLLALTTITTGYANKPEIETTKLDDAVRAQQIKDMKFGMFICWSFSTFSGQEWTKGVRDVNFFKAKTALHFKKHQDKDFSGFLVAEFTYPVLPTHKGGARWFYSLPEHDDLCHPAEKIYKDYLGAVRFGNIFSVNVGPNYEGKIRDIDVKTLKQVGDWIRSGHKLD